MHLPHWILQWLLSISTPGGESFDYPAGGMWVGLRSVVCVCVCVLHVCWSIYRLHLILLQKAMKSPKTPKTPTSAKKGKENMTTPSKVPVLLKKCTCYHCDLSTQMRLFCMRDHQWPLLLVPVPLISCAPCQEHSLFVNSWKNEIVDRTLPLTTMRLVFVWLTLPLSPHRRLETGPQKHQLFQLAR